MHNSFTSFELVKNKNNASLGTHRTMHECAWIPTSLSYTPTLILILRPQPPKLTDSRHCHYLVLHGPVW